MFTTRLLGAAALFCALAVPSSAQSIDSLSTTVGTTGTIFTMTGSGFGTAKPKVELVTDGSKAKGSLLKVVDWTDTTATIEIKKATAGEYGLQIRPKGKGIEPALAGDAFTIKTMEDVTPDVSAADPGEEVLVTAAYMGTKKAKVKIGGQKAPVTTWVPVDKALEGGESGFFIVKMPKKLANGTYAIEIVTKVGSLTIPEFIEIENSSVGQPKPGKVSLTCKIDGKGFKASTPEQLVWASACPGGPSTCFTSWAATQIAGSAAKSFMFNVKYDAAAGGAATFTGSNIIGVTYSEGLFSPTNYLFGNDFVVEITGKSGDQLIGKFSGTMNKTSGPGAPSITVSNGAFVLDKAPGL